MEQAADQSGPQPTTPLLIYGDVQAREPNPFFLNFLSNIGKPNKHGTLRQRAARSYPQDEFAKPTIVCLLFTQLQERIFWSVRPSTYGGINDNY